MSVQGFWKSSIVYNKIVLCLLWPLTVITIVAYCKAMSKQLKLIEKQKIRVEKAK